MSGQRRVGLAATVMAVVLVVVLAARVSRLRAADVTAKTAAATTTASPADPAAAAQQRATALRKKSLKDDDFVENEETNRDPFHSYLRLFADKVTIKTHKTPAVFDKYSLEELALIAVVSGDETPRAMFRDPLGLGQTVRQGDFLSKSGARVSKILSDRVIVEQIETNANGEAHTIEKAILVNPEEPPR